jgi:hypothetical protein
MFPIAASRVPSAITSCAVGFLQLGWAGRERISAGFRLGGPGRAKSGQNGRFLRKWAVFGVLGAVRRDGDLRPISRLSGGGQAEGGGKSGKMGDFLAKPGVLAHSADSAWSKLDSVCSNLT